jgi:hypothetical protein
LLVIFGSFLGHIVALNRGVVAPGLVVLLLVPQRHGALPGVLLHGDPALAVEELAEFLARVGGHPALHPEEQRPGVDARGPPGGVAHVAAGLALGLEVERVLAQFPLGADRGAVGPGVAALPLAPGLCRPDDRCLVQFPIGEALEVLG